MQRFINLGGILASIALIAFGIGSIVVSTAGRSEVRRDLKREQIVGTPDMTPAAIQAEAAKAGLKSVSLPTCRVAGQPVDTGARAKCFASYMRIHALEASGGLTYAQMPRYATANGQGTNDAAAAQKDPKSGRPVDNPVRNVWVTETALTTALHTSYFAEQVAMFGIVMGIALLLAGGGFLVLTAMLLLSRSRREAKVRSVSRGAVPAAA